MSERDKYALGYRSAEIERLQRQAGQQVDVLVIDAETFEQTDVIEPLSIVPDLNSVATSPGALWVATDTTGILQRFDIPS